MKHNPEDLFQSHRRMIWSLANSHAARHDLEPTDLESIGDEVFVRCLGKWDPDRAAFGTLLYRALSNAFADEARKMWNRRRYEAEAAYVQENTQAESAQRVADLLVEVGADAREVVRVLLAGDVMNEHSRRYTVRAAIRQLLKTRKRNAPDGGLHARWTDMRISMAFAELDAALA